MKILLNQKIELLVKLFAFIGIATSVLHAFSSSDIAYDTALYHLQKIRWLSEYGHVFGLANLDARLGYFSIIFYLGTLINIIFGDPQILLYVNLILVLGLIGILIFNKRKDQYYSKRIISAVFILLIIPYLGTVKSLHQQIWGMSVLIGLFFYLMGKKRTEVNVASVFLFIVILVSIKLSLAFIALLLIPFSLNIKTQKLQTSDFVKLTTGLLIVVLFLYHNYILTGWIIFPASSFDFFSPEWKVPKYLVENNEFVIKNFAKIQTGLAQLIVLDNSSVLDWVFVWFSRAKMFHYHILLGSISIVCYLVMLFRNRKRFILEAHFYLFLSVVIAMVLWWIKAPDLRYGSQWIIILIGINLWVLLPSLGLNKEQYAGVHYMLLLMTTGVYIYQSGLYSAIRIPSSKPLIDLSIQLPLAKFTSITMQVEGKEEAFFAPSDSELAYYYGPFPIASKIYTDSILPFINDVPRYLKSEFSEGFYTDSTLSVRNQGPRAIKSMLSSEPKKVH